MTTSADSAVEPIVDGPLTLDEAADAFMPPEPDASKPSAPAEKDEKDETAKAGADDTPEDEPADENPDENPDDPEQDKPETEDETSPKPQTAGDEDEVEFQVDGETRRVSVKDLKRLAGQEASLTRKSQEVAAQRKEAEARVNEYAAKLGQLVEKAKSRFAPFEQIDWTFAAAKLSPEDYQNLRAQAKEAHDDVSFLQGEADTLLRTAQENATKARTGAAQEAVKSLQERIPGWSNEVYSGLMDYAVENGISAEEIRNVVDPNVFVILHKARQFDQAGKVATVKKAAAPKKVVKPSATPPTATKLSASRALERLRQSGSIDDAADAFAAGMN